MQSSLFSKNNGGPTRRGSPPGTDTNRQQQQEMEEQVLRENEAAIEALGRTVGEMKSKANYLLNEAREHNDLLNGLAERFNSARGGVGTSIASLTRVMDRYGTRHTMYVACGIVAVLMLVYLFFTRSSTSA